MKKVYNIPVIEITKVECVQMMCLSILDGDADPGKEVLSKKRQETDEFVNGNDWNAVIGNNSEN